MQIGGIIDISTKDIPNKSSMVIFTVGCNLSCSFCHNKYLLQPNVGKNMVINEVLKQVRSNLLISGVSISGGEPTLQQDLIDLCREIRKIGKYLSLDTNGTTPHIIKKLIPYINRIALDLKGPLKKERYKEITGGNVDPNLIIETFHLVNKQKDIDLEIRTTYVENLIVPDDIHEIIDFLKKNEFKGTFVLQQYQYSEGVGEDLKNVFQKPEHLFLLNILKPYKDVKLPFKMFLRDEIVGYSNIDKLFEQTSDELKMNEKEILDVIQSCIDCKLCMDSCDTYSVTQDELKSPNGRLNIAEKVFKNEEISEEERIGLYTCTLCGMCDRVCQQNIPIAETIHSAKIKLVEQGKAPLDIHNKIIKGILEKDNSVNGDPEKRLDWIPDIYRDAEPFEKKNSDTLLFLGCMSSFRVKESASASYALLKEGNYNFKILEKEPCCGEYIYSAGNLQLAKKLFQENVELFKKIGIKTIIVTCGGCLYAFDKVYRKYFKDFNIEVKHIVEVIYELEKEGKIKLNPLAKSITYHDPCRLGRKYVNGPLYNEPRELLNKCGIKVKELVEEHDDCPCCGSGSGIRGVDSSICIKIGKQLFDKIETKEIASSCPLCVFNFRYVNYKTEADKECKYITDFILEALKKNNNLN